MFLIAEFAPSQAISHSASSLQIPSGVSTFAPPIPSDQAELTFRSTLRSDRLKMRYEPKSCQIGPTITA
jgi:hypothetical protein